MRKIYALLIALIATVSIQAQTQDNALYVYRNDGGFNAFLREDIDSIALSHFDLDSIEHKDPVCQVFFTPDSVYRIPIEAIDSVSFVQPEIIYNKNVVRMDELGTCAWLKEADGMKLVFNAEMPYSERPEKGQVLLYLKDDLQYFKEGFAGIVSSVSHSNNDIVVVCDSINDITDIFEQFVAIENIYTQEKNQTRANGSINGSCHINADLIYEPDASCPIQFSVAGGIEGNLALNIIYNITKENQSVSMTVKHDWTSNVHFSAKSDIPNSKHFWYPKSIPFPNGNLYFPQICPIFKMSIYTSPFVKTEGYLDVESSFTSPRNEYITGIIYENGSFRGDSRQLNGKEGDNPALSSKFSLKGSVHVGGLIGIYIGTIECVGVIGADLNLYMGPKLSADFGLELSSDKDINLYNNFKDNTIDVSWLTLDSELNGKAKFMGKGIQKHTFAKVSLSGFNHSWYLLPEYTEPKVNKTGDKTSAVLQSKVGRDLMLPVQLGLSVEDDKGKVIDTKWCDSDYRLEKDWPSDALCKQFDGLESGNTYTAYPYVRFLGYELKASPSKEFKIEGLPVHITDFKVTYSEYSWHAFTNDGRTYDYKFEVSLTAKIDNLDGVEDWGYVYKDPYGNIKRVSFMRYGTSCTDTSYAYYRNEEKSTACLYAYVKYEGDPEYYDTEPYDYPLEYVRRSCPDNNHYHAIDLGLPSGTKWCCCNVGASSPEDYGGYYAWGETSEKSVYTDDTYAFYDKKNKKYINIGSDIAGTEYDVAHVRMGGSWRMPTYEQQKELVECCIWKFEMLNGVKGQLVTGPNGRQIFLPEAGCRPNDDLNYAGWDCYWSSSSFPYENGVNSACSLTLNGYCYIISRYLGCPVRAVCP